MSPPPIPPPSPFPAPLSPADEPIAERDLLAYADGHLDRDPARRQAVELFLLRHPEEAQRMRAYALQDEAIRERFAGILAEPVPERLRQALEAAPVLRSRRAAGRIAAALALLATGALAGWSAGQPAVRDGEGGFVARTAAGFREPVEDGAATAAVQARPADWPAPQAGWPARQAEWPVPQVAVNVDIPDLGALGLQPVARSQLPAADGHSAVRIEYADATDRRVVLVIGPRWPEAPPQIRLLREDGLDIAVWQHGPLRYGLAAEGGAVPLEPLARLIVQRQDRALRAVGRTPEPVRDLHSLELPAASLDPPLDGEAIEPASASDGAATSLN